MSNALAEPSAHKGCASATTAMAQDLKLEIDQLTQREAVSALAQRRSKNIDAPSWSWTGIVELMASHEAGYLEHCRRYSLTPAH